MDKKTSINLNNNDYKRFQNVAAVALSHAEIGKISQRMPIAEPFIINYNRSGRNYIWRKDDSKKFEKNNPKTALNVLYVKKWIYTVPIVQNTTEIMKNKSFFIDFKRRKMAISCSKDLHY